MDVAEILEGACDELLIHGRSRDEYEGEDGSICLYNALIKSAARLGLAHRYYRARNELADRVAYPSVWNASATDDEVFDLLRNTAKELREEADA